MADEKDFIEEEFDEEPDDIVTLMDENGEEIQYEYLDTIEYNGREFIVLLPLDEADEDGGVVEILEITDYDEKTDMESYALVDTEETLNAVYELFKEAHKDEFNFV